MRLGALLVFSALGLAGLPAESKADDFKQRVAALRTLVAQQDAEIASLAAQIAAVRGRHAQQVLNYNSVYANSVAQQVLVGGYLPIINTLPTVLAPIKIEGKNMVIEGANFQIKHAFAPTMPANGLGNLIIGWNSADVDEKRTGSNNLILGHRHSYTAQNSIVGGTNNLVQGRYSHVLAGTSNEAAGQYGVVMTGSFGKAWGDHSLVLTGMGGRASNRYGLIGSGHGNTVLGGNSTAIMTGTQTWMHGTQNLGATGFGSSFNNNNLRSVMASARNFEWGGNYSFHTEHGGLD